MLVRFGAPVIVKAKINISSWSMAALHGIMSSNEEENEAGLFVTGLNGVL